MCGRRVLLPAPTKPTRSVVSVVGRHGSPATRARLPRRRSPPAGHVDGHAGDEVSVAGGEEADHPCLVGRLGDPAERRAGDFLRLLVQGPLRPPRPDAFGQRQAWGDGVDGDAERDRKSTRLNSSHLVISYAVFCLKKKKKKQNRRT